MGWVGQNVESSKNHRFWSLLPLARATQVGPIFDPQPFGPGWTSTFGPYCCCLFLSGGGGGGVEGRGGGVR